MTGPDGRGSGWGAHRQVGTGMTRARKHGERVQAVLRLLGGRRRIADGRGQRVRRLKLEGRGAAAAPEEADHPVHQPPVPCRAESAQPPSPPARAQATGKKTRRLYTRRTRTVARGDSYQLPDECRSVRTGHKRLVLPFVGPRPLASYGRRRAKVGTATVPRPRPLTAGGGVGGVWVDLC